MERKHSPAPWAVKGYFKVVSAPIEREGYTTVRHGICDVEQGSYVGMSWEEKESNARLIASAPELLAILRELVEDIQDEAISTGVNDTIRRANQIIDKALGL